MTPTHTDSNDAEFSTDDPTRRTDLRTVEPHYSAAEVYAALGCAYPGTTDDWEFVAGTRRYRFEPGVSVDSKVRDSRAEGTGGQVPVPSRDDGLNIPFATDGYAVRRHVGSSGFETDEYARYDRTNDGEEYRTVTDGGHEPTEFDVGERVVDRDADDPNTAVVVARPDARAYDYTLDALDGSPSVADLNTEYAASGPVATVAFAGELADALDVWREADPEALAELCDDESVRTYTYPVDRLRGVSDE